MSVRAFIAVEVPPAAIESLVAAQAALRTMIGRLPVKWTRPEGMHLTLRFVGDVPEDAAEPLCEAVGRACAMLRPFQIELSGGLSCFPSAGRARIIWARFGGDLETLQDLHRVVASASDRFVARRDDRDFVPHLTLGRVGEARGDERKALAAAISIVRTPQAQWRVGSVRVMRSFLKPEGAEHALLAECPLKSD